jgi:hypothetical protein
VKPLPAPPNTLPHPQLAKPLSSKAMSLRERQPPKK